MRPPKYIVYYLTAKERILLGISWNPAQDYCFWQSRGYSPPKALSRPVSLFTAERLLANFTDEPFTPQKMSLLKRLRLSWRSRKFKNKQQSPASPPGTLPAFWGPGDLEQILCGRLYLWQELVRLWRGGDLVSQLQRLILEGKCQLKAAVGLDSWGRLVCRRCGSVQVVANRWCCKETICFECQACSALGKATSCSPLVAMPRQGEDRLREVKIKLSFALTPAQGAACRQLVEFIYSPLQNCLLWAVCGAGKTEVSYQAAKLVLAKGGRVLFAIPRRSVVQELAERIKEAFSGVQVQVLYGGVDLRQRRLVAPLVIATTHQVLRFYSNFDLVILDEVDAFPYRGSQMLQGGIQRALRPGGKQILMTATPDRRLLARAQGNNWSLVRLPVRPHGHPLPEPRIMVLPSLSQKPLHLPLQVLAAIRSSKRLFLFVPSVELGFAVARKLKGSISKVASCHAKDPKRDQKLLAFRQGELRVLVATTVAERGITVPGADAMVLFADCQLFDERVLVQMAGRVGRAWDRPTGKVWFVAASRSQSMVVATEQIRQQNQEAQRSGLLAAA